MAVNHNLKFTEIEMLRLREACRILGTSYSEFIHQATNQAVSEVLGINNQVAASRQVSEHRIEVR